MRIVLFLKSIHYDLFEDVSTTKNVLESDWRLCMDFSDRNVVVDKSTLQNQITIQHILVALEHGFKQVRCFLNSDFRTLPFSREWTRSLCETSTDILILRYSYRDSPLRCSPSSLFYSIDLLLKMNPFDGRER